MVASSSTGTQNGATGNVLASGSGISLYRTSTPSAALAPQTIGPVGGNQPHDNMQPYLCINYIISLFGIFPSQT
jgi:microcystin-dependent protein